MAGLLDIDMNTPEGQGFNNALMQAAAMLLTPRHRGGGVGSAFAAFPQAIEQSKQAAMRNRLLGLQESQLGLQTAEAKRKAEADALARTNLARFIAGLPPEQQAAATLAPEKAAESRLPGKPQLVKYYDAQGREVNGWALPGQEPTPIGGAKAQEQLEIERLVAARDRLPEGDALRGIYDGRIQKLTTHAPGAKVEVNMGQKGFENTRALRNDFTALPVTKAFNEMQGTADIIKGALSNPSPANDMAAATKFMKMLDPGSVVRESELGMAMSATGLLDKVLNYANMIVKGHKLTPAQRKDFYDSTQRMMADATKRYNAEVARFRKEASRWELDPDSVAEPAAMPPSVDDLVKQYGG